MIHVNPVFKTTPERHREEPSTNVATINIIISEEELVDLGAKIGVRRGCGKKKVSLGGRVKMSLLLLPWKHPTRSCLIRGSSITFDVNRAVSAGESPGRRTGSRSRDSGVMLVY